MPINVLVNGAFGRMGQLATKAINDDQDLNLVGQTGREYDLKRAIKDSDADVVIDFTHPDVVFDNTNIIMESGAHPVIGTSGLTKEQIQQLQAKSKGLKLGGMIVPNFSIGALLMIKCAKEIIKYMPNAEIIEMHHEGKADSPSGTALRTAEILTTERSVNQPKKSSIETIPGARGASYQGLPIHAIRLPGLLAHQKIIFGNTGETLSITHDSIDRQCFMPGVTLACKKVVKLDHLIYGLEEIL